MPKQRFIKLPSGDVVPLKANNNGIVRPEMLEEPPQRKIVEEEPMMEAETIESESEEIETPVTNQILGEELLEEETDVENLDDMFQSSLDRNLVNKGIEEVTGVTDEDVMGEEGEESTGEEIDDLFDVSREDVMGGEVDDLVAQPEPENLDDLLTLDEKTQPQQNVINRPILKNMKFRRTNKPYPPQTGMRGIR